VRCWRRLAAMAVRTVLALALAVRVEGQCTFQNEIDPVRGLSTTYIHLHPPQHTFSSC
jgi:hypothetical protein